MRKSSNHSAESPAVFESYALTEKNKFKIKYHFNYNALPKKKKKSGFVYRNTSDF